MSLALTELLYDALRSPYGTVIETDDAERLRQKLYAIRKQDEALAPLAFVISPMNGSDLWILNRSNQDAPEC